MILQGDARAIPPAMTYISLGAGVQSSALFVMSALGLHGCPRADVAIFADTQDEPVWVYRQIEALRAWSTTIPVETVTVGRLSDDSFVSIPAFTRSDQDARGMLRRQCTVDYKITPINRRVRERLGLKKHQRAKDKYAVALLGISLDEAHRMSDSREPYIIKKYPLVEAALTRRHCEQILARAGLPIPKKSACVFCPFHSDSYWLDLKRHHPDEWIAACRYDERIRNSTRAGVHRQAFVHSTLKPLIDVDLAEAQGELFGNDCDGICGV